MDHAQAIYSTISKNNSNTKALVGAYRLPDEDRTNGQLV